MFFKPERTHAPVRYAKRVEIEKIPTISRPAKAFLKEKAIQTMLCLFEKLTEKDIKLITDKAVRNEIHNLYYRTVTLLKKPSVKVTFSRNISAPFIIPFSDESRTLIALLIFESFFGNRRSITAVKHAHLPRLYSAAERNEKPPTVIRNISECRLAQVV